MIIEDDRKIHLARPLVDIYGVNTCGIVDEPVHTGISVGEITSYFVPSVYWDLAGEEDRVAVITLFENFAEITVAFPLV